jgi:hypothetical protein
MLDWLEQHLLSCPIRSFYGIDCPGCGLQRSILLLLKGEVWESVQMYPATIPMISVIILFFLHLKFEIKWAPKMLVFLYSITGIIVLVHYVWKIYNHQLCTLH